MRAFAVAGEVVVFGPGPLAGAFTPEAAEETAQALLDAALEARDQSSVPSPPGEEQ